MTHELKKIIEAYQKFASKNEKCVLATVVSIDGSSYRRPGVSMLISNSGNMIGAVSGGCVEKDILRESKSVFENDRSKMMTYNGKFRLGCEGTLYILIERFAPNSNFIEAFANALQKRINFTLKSNYRRDLNNDFQLGTIMQINDQSYHFNQDANYLVFPHKKLKHSQDKWIQCSNWYFSDRNTMSQNYPCKLIYWDGK